MNIGAGRIVWQSLSRINNSIKTGEFNNNEAINNAIENAKKNGKKFHIFGLCSDGGVHSHTSHITMHLWMVEIQLLLVVRAF